MVFNNSTANPTPLWAQNAIVYEMRIETFTDVIMFGKNASSFQAATTLLSQLADLGITLLSLNPILNDGCTSVTIDPRILNAYSNKYPNILNPCLSTNRSDPTQVDQEFTQFVSTAHQFGMHVIVDNVVHGIDPSSTYITTLPADFFMHYENGSFIITQWGTVALDWSSQALRSWWISSIGLKWVHTYDIDGFRIDLEPAYVGSVLWKELRDSVENMTGKQILLITELINSQGTQAYTFDFTQNKYLLFSNTTNYPDFMNGLNLVDECSRNYETYVSVGISNHDSSRYAAFGRLSYFGYAFILSPMVPRFFQGEEFNATYDWFIGPNVLYFNQLDWQQNSYSSNIYLRNQVKRLISIRKQYRTILAPLDRPLNRVNILRITQYSNDTIDLEPYSMWNEATNPGASITVLASRNSSGLASLTIPLQSMSYNMTLWLHYHIVDLLNQSLLYIVDNPNRNQTQINLHLNLDHGSVVPILIQGCNTDC
ncbi:unnamed protein product [Didymodactylos carnosus]|uniref:Glycosyl hydrolase family 13 catalytic domain-containing protein n=1 Tax=Didymodactylos carnosus TaxID=1234261 RepID=A0A8S2NZL8_9BILA|nr:unnamed protein product [Didymodactylos carnosus]CAF4027818.1 unnamed protein product [Didymodactylos carnosus]